MEEFHLLMKELYLFEAGSRNEETNKHLRIKGASLFIPQLNQLLEHTKYSMRIYDVTEFNNDHSKLGSILSANKSDKSTTHNYDILYSYIFNKLGESNSLNVLEIGLGTNNPTLISSMGSGGRPGASLYAWRDYLPNASIYGADIDRDILFQADRITTSFVDQLDLQTLNNLIPTFNNIQFDLIIDDGLHSIGANFNTLLFALNNIKNNGWIVIEDIQERSVNNWKSIDFILSTNPVFKTFMVRTKHSYAYLVNKLV
jgi:hypothetical protein